MEFDLDEIRVASPCAVSWEDMDGDDQMRHCQHCKLNVFNLSEMSREEAEALIREKHGGRLCVRFYQRADGTVMTKDCPVGRRRERNRKLRWVAGIAAVLALLFRGGAVRANANGSINTRYSGFIDKISHTLNIPGWCTCQTMVMGDICVTPVAPPPPVAPVPITEEPYTAPQDELDPQAPEE